MALGFNWNSLPPFAGSDNGNHCKNFRGWVEICILNQWPDLSNDIEMD